MNHRARTHRFADPSPADPVRRLRHRRFLRSAAARGLAVAAAALSVAAALPAQEFPLGSAHVAVSNVAGRVEVVRGGGDEAVVQVLARGGDAARLRVEVGQVDGRDGLRVHYPDDTVIYQGSGGGRFDVRLRVNGDGTFGGGWGLGGDRVQVRSGGNGLEAHADLRIALPPGGSLILHHGVGAVTASGLSGDLFLNVASGPVEVSAVEGLLSVDTGSGQVQVSRVMGEVTVDTGSGSVSLRDIRGSAVGVDTGSGGVDARNVRADYLGVDTGSGSVELEDIEAPEVVVDTGSGRVTLAFRTAPENVVVDTGSGSVTLTLPDGVDAEIEADSGSGGVQVEIPGLQVLDRDRDHLSGRVGSGAGRIVVDTGSGAIRIRGGR